MVCSNATISAEFGSQVAAFNTAMQIAAFKRIQLFVLLTIFVLLLQLGHLVKPFAYGFFRMLSWFSYLSIPSLISYIIGLMEKPVSGFMGMDVAQSVDPKVSGAFQYLACVWVIFLMFAHAGFDNLTAFTHDEGQERFKIVLQMGQQFVLFLLVLYHLPADIQVTPIVWAFVVLTCKFVGRLVALAHSTGQTPRIKKDVVRIIKYMNQQADANLANPVTMEGYKYLVGPKFSNLEEKKKQEEEEELSIVDGITLEKIWGTEGKLLKPSNMEFKDTCLSFALFWVLLGKFWSYPLYSNIDIDEKATVSFKPTSSRAKAWKLVRHGLLAEEGSHERVFRVIEVELAFLRDYFHAKYMFFYLNGFSWKLISIVALPAMFWWFIHKSFDQKVLGDLQCYPNGDLSLTKVANTIVISVIVALEAMQLHIFLSSRWVKVALYCLYVKKKVSQDTCFVTNIFLEFLGCIFVGSARSSNTAWWRKPWKRELDQFSLVQSCTTSFKPSSYLKVHFSSIVGVPLSKTDRKLGKKIELSEQVKKAVVVCLQRNNRCPKLSSGTQSLRRNGVLELDYKFNNDIETIVVWHIATSVCEFDHGNNSNGSTPGKGESANDHMKVANDLSKYCAYLLFFSPSLLSFPTLESEAICDVLVKEANKNFKKMNSGCLNRDKEPMYDKVKKLIEGNDEEAGDKGRVKSLIIKGAFLGKHLIDMVGDKEKKWKILAEFWAEMILYMAPSDNNGMEHASKLSEGGEFITQLWALLIHAGITNRDDMVAALQQDGDA